MTLTLTQGQQEADQQFMAFMIDPKQREMIISGFAGTGKSTLTKHILSSLDKKMQMLNLLIGGDAYTDIPIHVTATTNKAAQVIGKVTGYPPQTIHSLLGLKVSNDFKTGKTKLEKTRGYKVLERSLIIIDEASYIDAALLKLIRESTIGCKVLYIGDPYQLAPTFESSSPVFNEGLPETRLTEVMRNNGLITQLSSQCREAVITGDFQALVHDHQQVVHLDGPAFRGAIDTHFADKAAHNCRILAWTNDRVHAYNNYVRELQGYGPTLEVGEMVITNNSLSAHGYATDSHLRVTGLGQREVFEGIHGQNIILNKDVKLFLPDNQYQVKAVLRNFARSKDWGSYFTVKETCADLRPLHASTVHKSQGSTYDKVFIDLSDIGRCNIPGDAARILYVAISRASQQVILYGDLPEKYGGIQHVSLAS